MTTNTLDISEARKQFNSLDQRLRDERMIVVKRHNKEVFGLIDLDFFEALMETMYVLADPEAMTMLEESINDIQNGRVHDHEDIKREML